VRWLFGWGEWVSRSGPTPRRDAVERKIEDAHARGWVALKRRRFEEAASAYREAAELGDLDAMVSLANILSDELNSSDEGERWYRRAIESGSTTAAENLALQRLNEDRVEEARELFELARRRGDSAGYLGLADIAAEEGQLERARSLSEIAIMEDELDAYGPLGRVLAAMGQWFPRLAYCANSDRCFEARLATDFRSSSLNRSSSGVSHRAKGGSCSTHSARTSIVTFKMIQSLDRVRFRLSSSVPRRSWPSESSPRSSWSI
jgi:tetratricopeptide (TPR) repeat protein